MNTIAKKISKTLLIAVAAMSLVSSANANASNDQANDYQITLVSGKSMLPTLKNGETAVVYQAYPFEKLRLGDVVIIDSESGQKVIHRIVRRGRGGAWVTQGDNNRHEDREILSKHNFGGLALVDDSMVRYREYVASIAPQKNKPCETLVAMADSTHADRFDSIRNL